MTKWVLTLGVIAGLAAAQAVSAGEGCGASKSSCEGKKDSAKVKTIDTEGLQTLLASGEQVAVIDARSAKYDDGQRIPGATALTADATEEQIAAALPSKDTRVVTYCSNLKCPASEKLAERLQALGYTDVVKYPEGIQGWTEAGKDVVTVEKPAATEG